MEKTEADLPSDRPMTQINPFTGAIIQSTQVQPRQGADKDRAIRRMQNLGRNAALQGDRLEHQVESADALHPSDDGHDLPHQQQRRQEGRHAEDDQAPPDNDPGHIDLTA